MKRIVLWVIGAAVAIFILMQLIPVNKTNPPVSREVKWDSPQTRALAQRACFDCHSNETIWPWYAKIAPLSLYLANHVDEGRGRLNFSAWDQPQSSIREMERTITNGQMPLWDYLLAHPDAKLTDAEKQQLINGLQATYKQDPPTVRQGGFGD